MSVKISKYLLVIFLTISIAIISSGIVNATCYVYTGTCSWPDKINGVSGVDYFELNSPNDDSCAQGIADACKTGCCCVGDKNYDYNQGFCSGLSGSSFDPTTTGGTDDCNTFCTGPGQGLYNITGYVKNLNNGFFSGANVSLNDGLFNFTTGADGKYNFSNLHVQKYSITAKGFVNNNICSDTKPTTELLSRNQEINLTLLCSTVKVSGFIFNEDRTMATSATVKLFIGTQNINTISILPSGFYSFDAAPGVAQLLIKANNSLGCEDDLSVTTTSVDSSNQNLTLICGIYNISGKVSKGTVDVKDATISAYTFTNTTDSQGFYALKNLPKGLVNITATKIFTEYNGLSESTITCTNKTLVNLTTSSLTPTVSFQFTTLACCNKTISRTACVNGKQDKLTTYTGGVDGKCGGQGTQMLYNQDCAATVKCQRICKGSWSTCDGTAVQSICDNPQIDNSVPCDINNINDLAVPRPCNRNCGNGNLDSNEECDYSPTKPFQVITTCNSSWKTNLAKTGYTLTDNDIMTRYAVQSLMCNFATCECNLAPVNPNEPNSCTVGEAKLLGFSATPITASDNVSLDWHLSPTCENYIDHFELRRCTKDSLGGCDYFLINDNINNLSQNYIDKLVPYEINTRYYYKLTAVFNKSVENRTVNLTAWFDTGINICLDKNPNSWCEGNVKWNCSELNVAQKEDCYLDGGKSCEVKNEVATCVKQANCDICNGVFGVFGYQGYKIDTMVSGDSTKYEIWCPSLGPYGTESRNPKSLSDNVLGGCYMDYTMTAVDKAYSCSNVDSCYDYFSESSCTSDYCNKFLENGVKQCVWKNQTTGVSSIFKKGVCSPNITAQQQPQQCGLCNDVGVGAHHNRLDYSNCSKNTCENLFGNCYFEPSTYKCINKANLKCSDYKLQSECTGGRNVSTFVQWTIGLKPLKINGSNSRINSSDGGVTNGTIGICKWTDDPDIINAMGGSNCFRDADNLTRAGDYDRKDCNIQSISGKPLLESKLKDLCEADIIAPITSITPKPIYALQMNLTDQVKVTDNNQWDLGDSSKCSNIGDSPAYCNYIQLWYCVVAKGLTCYPNQTLSVTEQPYIVNLSKWGLTKNSNGNEFTMYYFSEDPAKNLEYPIQNFNFTADTKSPNVSVTLDKMSYSISDYEWLTNLSVTLELKPTETEPVTCTFKVFAKGDANLSFLSKYKYQYNIPPLYDFSKNELPSEGSTLNTTYPELVDGRYSYYIDCVDAIGNHYTNTSEFNITGNVLINSPIPQNMKITSYGNIISGGKVNISVNTSVNGTCWYAPTRAYSYEDSIRFDGTESISSGTFNKYHNATITLEHVSSTSPLYISKVYREFVWCNLTINEKNYTVHGSAMSDPTFTIDDLPPNTTISIKNQESTVQGNDFKAYNYTGIDYTSHATIRLGCDDSNDALTPDGERMDFGCRATTNPTYYCIANTTNNKCSVLENYAPFNSDIEFDYSNGKLTNKSLYGNSPVIYYYSVDNGGNNASPKNTTLRIKNTQIEEPNIKVVLQNGSTVNIPKTVSVDVKSALIKIIANYTYEKNVTIINHTLRYTTLGPDNYVELPNVMISNVTNDGAIYAHAFTFETEYLNNGEYTFIMEAKDDDNNTVNYTARFKIAHDNNVITLISPKLGIGTTSSYDIIINTTFTSECRYALEQSQFSNIREKWFATISQLVGHPDQRYKPFTSTNSKTHTFKYDSIFVPQDTLYIICKIAGSSDTIDSSFSDLEIPIGYNSSTPNITITFIHDPARESRFDNMIIRPENKYVTMKVFTDQPSVCSIYSNTNGVNLNINPAQLFFKEEPYDENYSDYYKYYTEHTYPLDYSEYGIDGTYDYTINCTSRAQLSSINDTSVILNTHSDPPLMHINAEVKYLTLHRYNVSCYGLCMGEQTHNYSYATISKEKSCDSLTDGEYTVASYSYKIEITENSTICVKGEDLLHRVNTTSLEVNISDFNHGEIAINYPYAYYDKINGVKNSAYSPNQNFTFNITTINFTTCKLIPWNIIDTDATNTAKEIYEDSQYDDYVFNHTSTTLINTTNHTTSVALRSDAKDKDVWEVICVQEGPSDTLADRLYVSRELFFYWDNTPPVISMDIIPQIMRDWTSRSTVSLNITTSDESMCSLNLTKSTVKVVNKTSGVVNTIETLNYTAENIVLLDSGDNELFNSYTNNRARIYSLPPQWLTSNSIYTSANYTFHIDCINRAKETEAKTGSMLYNLDNKVNITKVGSNVSDNLQIPFNITTNINSICNASIGNGNRKILQTINGINHNTSFTVVNRGSHIINVLCYVPTNDLITKGNETYTVFVDTIPPTITNLTSTLTASSCMVFRGFNVLFNMTDDTGIKGYSYRITKQSTTIFGPNFTSSGNTATITYTEDLSSNTAYSVYVTAIDLANKPSATQNITIATGNATASCGNGCLDTVGEYCEGSNLNGQTCKSIYAGTKYVGGKLRCNAPGTANQCNYNYDQCDDGRGYCGNDKVDGPNTLGVYEQCDGDIPSSLTCKKFGFTGPSSGGLQCNPDCTVNTSRCVNSGVQSVGVLSCNGMFLQPSEQCESTYNTSSTLTCMSFGYTGGTLSCYGIPTCNYNMAQCSMNKTSTPNTPSSNKCGNNVTEGTEKCDGTSGLSIVSCKTLGNFTSGTVSCTKTCTYNLTKCIYNVSACSNGKKDATESDIDCGGTCSPCSLNKNCTINSNCASGKCDNVTKKCALAPCNNTIFDSDTETDVDCGKTCKVCELSKNCLSNTDCKSNFCIANKCATDPCNNGVQDGTESDIDCGGDCMLCDIDQTCNTNSDCSSDLCENNVCIEAGTAKNPIKLPLMIIGLIMILGSGGYVIYKTFILKPTNTGGHSGQFGKPLSMNNMTQPVMPTGPIKLTPEQEEIAKKQHEAMMKKRQSRSEDRKGILRQLGDKESTIEEKSKDSSDKGKNSANKLMSNIQKKNAKLDSKDSEDFVELSELKNSKTNKKDSFEKLKSLHTDEMSTKIANMSKTLKENIKPVLDTSSALSDTGAIKMFGEMNRETLMSGVFKDVLSELLESKKLTKENVSKILFEYMDKGLLNKGDVAKISSELKII